MVRLSKGMPSNAVGNVAERLVRSTAGMTGPQAGGVYSETRPPAVTRSLVHTEASETRATRAWYRESTQLKDEMLLSRSLAHPGEVFTHL